MRKSTNLMFGLLASFIIVTCAHTQPVQRINSETIERIRPQPNPKSKIANPISGMPPIKAACLYEPLTSTIGGRNIDKVVDMLSDLKPDLIFRAFFKWGPCPQAKYDELKQAIAKLKTKLPNVLIVGGVAPQFLPRNEIDPDTGLPIRKQILQEMAFKPESLGIGFDPDRLPRYFDAMSNSEIFSPRGGFFPDMANNAGGMASSLSIQSMGAGWACRQPRLLSVGSRFTTASPSALTKPSWS